jgi:hypothetical protein
VCSQRTLRIYSTGDMPVAPDRSYGRGALFTQGENPLARSPPARRRLFVRGREGEAGALSWSCFTGESANAFNGLAPPRCAAGACGALGLARRGH